MDVVRSAIACWTLVHHGTRRRTDQVRGGL